MQKNIEQLEFEHQGLQNLYTNLTDESNTLVNDNDNLVTKNMAVDEKVLYLSDGISRITTEKEVLSQELGLEHIKVDEMIEEVNHLRMKSKTLSEDIKNFKNGVDKRNEDIFEPQVQALEIDRSSEVPELAFDIEIVSLNTDTSAHYPGAFSLNEEKR